MEQYNLPNQAKVLKEVMIQMLPDNLQHLEDYLGLNPYKISSR